MSDERQALTDKAFGGFDKDGCGSIEVADLQKAFNC
jgi:hypothetical protein